MTTITDSEGLEKDTKENVLDFYKSHILSTVSVLQIKDVTCKLVNTNVYTNEIDEKGIPLCEAHVAEIIKNVYCPFSKRPKKCQKFFQNFINECIVNESDTINVGDNGFDIPQFTLKNKSVDCSSFMDEVASHRWIHKVDVDIKKLS